ncbi:hypothetical protein R6Q59_036235 [Mikania micrantha]
MAVVDEFSRSVDTGLRLSKRIYYGKDGASMSAPKQPSMEKSLSSSSSASSLRLPQNHHPTAPMVYAVITEPVVVDNPDIRSYQPYDYGRCDPPALIPLHMLGVTLKVDCYLDTAVVTVDGDWRVHCLTSSALCDLRIAIPMGEQAMSLRSSYNDLCLDPTSPPPPQKEITPENPLTSQELLFRLVRDLNLSPCI